MKRIYSYLLLVVLLGLPALACGTSTSANPTIVPSTVSPTSTPIPKSSPTSSIDEANQPGSLIAFEDNLSIGTSDGFGLLALGDNTVKVSVEPNETLDVIIEIQDESKSTITSVNMLGMGGTETLTYTFPSGAPLTLYYIVIISNNGQGDYETRMIGSSGIAFDLLNHFLIGTTVDKNSFSMFTVIANSGQKLTAIANPVEGDPIDPVVRVFRVSDAQTILAEFNLTGKGEDELVNYDFPDDGAYFLQVGDANNNGGRLIMGVEVK